MYFLNLALFENGLIIVSVQGGRHGRSHYRLAHIANVDKVSSPDIPEK